MPAPWCHALLDDAAVLPPRGLSLDRALEAHASLRSGDLGEVVGGVAVTDRELPHLPPGDLPVHLRVTGGAGMLEAALRSLVTSDLAVRRVEIALRDEADLAHNARRVVQVLDVTEAPEDLAVHVALPVLTGEPTAGWLGALDELAARELGVLLAHAPGPGTAAAIEAALDRELPLALVGDGLDDALTGLRAVRVALDGDGPAAVAAALGDADAAVAWVRDDPDAARRTRRWCVSVAVPDLAVALDDLSVRDLT
ncbi:hypothetical protein ASG49_17700 [Marmoricola sp. Leaf446]|uniref:hypothetical protein n=1 Tax=Marmoricola sp. Leaf446 TaxID=1736379 RepID=UPI0006FBBA42|nr:hypothetical protein [Marmoricola sp. Leaf446]KQT89561.1 hypothetical protein ASG49_17700 [Marmoricola sp. Leaf446]